MSEHIKVEESYVDALINNAAWGAAKVKLDEAALSPAQKQLDKDGDGKIEGEDLAKLRKKKDKKADKPEAPEKQEESVEEHTCPLCESVLEEELSDERIYEHVNDILEAVQTLEEAAAADDDDKVEEEEEEEEEVDEAAMGDDDDTDEMAMNASKKKMKAEKVMKKVKELKAAAKKGK
jgi:hypothetical protein